ncbi:MAG TPA: hypothetical protein VMZ91_01955 [Candidatus Paceibacterota bacterium]|nr:hypothetical protein [Candidatus Paceibacterota bacterium]
MKIPNDKIKCLIKLFNVECGVWKVINDKEILYILPDGEVFSTRFKKTEEIVKEHPRELLFFSTGQEQKKLGVLPI